MHQCLPDSVIMVQWQTGVELPQEETSKTDAATACSASVADWAGRGCLEFWRSLPLTF